MSLIKLKMPKIKELLLELIAIPLLTSKKTPSYAGGLGKLIVLPRVTKIPTPI